MPKASELQPGDTVLAWMRTGYALRQGRHPDGRLYWYVPSRPDRFDRDALQKFTGQVMANDPKRSLFTFAVQAVNKHTMGIGPAIQAEIPYLALWRLRRVSKVSHPGKPLNPARPTLDVLGSEFSAYRTCEEVTLRWA